VDPVSIYEKLCKVVEDPKILDKNRKAGLDYVHAWHSPSYVAGLTKAAYEK